MVWFDFFRFKSCDTCERYEGIVNDLTLKLNSCLLYRSLQATSIVSKSYIYYNRDPHDRDYSGPSITLWINGKDRTYWVSNEQWHGKRWVKLEESNRSKYAIRKL